MPPYWDNKALPTPTLTLPDTSFSPFWLFPSFLLKIIAFPMWYEIWKGRKFFLAKDGFELGSISSKRLRYALYQLCHWSWLSMAVFCSVDCPNPILVGGVSVNSLYQQGGLFALLRFVFFAHRKYSRSFITLRLNHWCHMDYFNDVLATFLGLESVSCIVVYGRPESSRISSKYRLERHEGE